MAQFHVTFQVQGSGSVDLPVTPLDELIVLVNGLEIKTFRFSVSNITAAALTLDITSTQSGPDADKVTVTFDSNPVSIEPGVSATITATIAPLEPLLEGDSLDVAVVGTSV